MTALFEKMGIAPGPYLIAVLTLVAGSLCASILSRFIFGKRSNISNAISSAIGILFIYAVTIVLRSTGAVPDNWVAPLPFIDIRQETLTLFRFEGAHYTAICTNLLSMVVLAFTVNAVDNRMPRGKKVVGWFFYRILTVSIAYILHLIIVSLFTKYVPEGLVTYAPTVLLVLLLTMLLTGALKLLVGAMLTTLNPIIGGLYTFFFATVIGKMVSKALLTTALLCLIVLGLSYLGIATISITTAALGAYIPLVILLGGIWFVQHKFF